MQAASGLRKVLLCLFFGATLSGCAIGNDLRVEAHRSTTVGQELRDLEKAKAEGLVNDQEYQSLREEIMQGGPWDIDLDTDS